VLPRLRSFAATEDSAKEGNHMAGDGMPRWAKLAGIVVAVLILLFVVMMLVGGGGMGHQIPSHGGGAG
jgi:ABC-type Fe3+ transport system permease subunit